MSAKAKRVLPTRPRAPGAAELLADVGAARAADPVLAPPAEPPAEPRAGAADDVESLFGQSRRYVELHQRLRQSGGRLRAGCEGLRSAGAALDLGLARMRRSAC